MAVSSEILELMTKLKNMTTERGCTPAEAENAAVRLHTLLQKHQLSISDINAQTIEEGVEKIVLERPDGKKWGYGVIEFATQIGYAFDCQMIYTAHRLAFVGIESDVRVATFFFDQTHEKVMDAGRTLGRAEGITGAVLVHYVQNFVSGAGEAIMTRLERQKTGAIPPRDQMVNLDDQQRCAALVPIKQQKVQEFVAQAYPDSRAVPLRKRRDGARDGWEYGNRMDLQYGLDGARAGGRAAIGGGA